MAHYITDSAILVVFLARTEQEEMTFLRTRRFEGEREFPDCDRSVRHHPGLLGQGQNRPSRDSVPGSIDTRSLEEALFTLLALQTAQVPRKANGSLTACQLFGDFRDTRDLPGWLP